MLIQCSTPSMNRFYTIIFDIQTPPTVLNLARVTRIRTRGISCKNNPAWIIVMFLKPFINFENIFYMNYKKTITIVNNLCLVNAEPQ